MKMSYNLEETVRLLTRCMGPKCSKLGK